jgi:hypothetical protein
MNTLKVLGALFLGLVGIVAVVTIMLLFGPRSHMVSGKGLSLADCSIRFRARRLRCYPFAVGRYS